MNKEDLVSNVLLHMYNSVVVGSVNSTSILLRMRGATKGNPRAKDVQSAYDALGKINERLFFDFVVAIAEFSTYSALYFVEHYNRFDAKNNANEFPRVSLVYSEIEDENIKDTILSTFGTDNLGGLFSKIAKDPEVRELIDAAIRKIVDTST